MYILATILLCLSPFASAGQFAKVQAIKAFADRFLDPVEVVNARGVGVFSEDVVGKVDVLTTFTGRELAADYLFGPFAAAAQNPSTLSPFGVPTAYNVTALAVQHDTVTASIVFDLHYSTLNATVPFQIDGWYLVNDEGEVSQYEVTFRHFSWAVDQLLPALVPLMAQELGTTAGNTSQILEAAMIASTCLSAVSGCAGSNAVYQNYADCATQLGNKSLGEWEQLADDSILCRATAAQLIGYDPALHCPELAAQGKSVCIAQDYASTITNALPHTWNAPKFITPENKALVGDMQTDSATPLSPLLELSLSTQEVHSWDPSFFATATFGYFLFLYFFAKALWAILMRTSKVFKSIEQQHQKNVVMYAMNIIFTTIALVLEVFASPSYFGHYTLWSIKCLRGSAIIIAALYIFELVFRFDMRLPLTCHHVLTIVAISFTITCFEYTSHPGYTVTGMIWLFQATTEQPTFVGLMGYRMKWNKRLVSRILMFAAVQTFIFKSISAVGIVVWWAKYQNYNYRRIDLAWTCLVFILCVGLLLTQVWGSYVTYIIGLRIARKPQSTPSGPTPSNSSSPLNTLPSSSNLEARPSALRFNSDSTIVGSEEKKVYDFSARSSRTALGGTDEFGRLGDVGALDHGMMGKESEGSREGSPA